MLDLNLRPDHKAGVGSGRRMEESSVGAAIAQIHFSVRLRLPTFEQII